MKVNSFDELNNTYSSPSHWNIESRDTWHKTASLLFMNEETRSILKFLWNQSPMSWSLKIVNYSNNNKKNSDFEPNM